jgi:hypothetical protein
MTVQISPPAVASATSKRRPCTNRLMPFPPELIGMLFTENAANSSLRVCWMTALELTVIPTVVLVAAIQSQYLPRPAATPA